MDAAVDALGVQRPPEVVEDPLVLPRGDSEVIVTRRQRRHQRFFREQLLGAYDGRCAITGLDIPQLNVASHIIPWAENEQRRADPTNGILLNALLDRAFDRGFITFENFCVVCSRELEGDPSREVLRSLAGRRLRAPDRWAPDEAALRWHRENRFLDRPKTS
jgi:predicted restriction endonuclease